MTNVTLAKIVEKVSQSYQVGSSKWISQLNYCIERQNLIEKRRQDIKKELMDELAKMEKECFHDFQKHIAYEHSYEECVVCGFQQ